MDKQRIPIGAPCHLDWRKMTPADGGRFCGDCKKVVRDLSAMSKAEAEALIAERKNEELCVRYVYDRFGRVVFRKDDGLIPASLLLRGRRALLTVAALVTPAALQACNPFGGEIMGDMAVDPTYQPEADAGQGGDAQDAAPDSAADAGPDAKSDAAPDAAPDADRDASAPDATPL
jgi:hypothetical protein